MDKEGHDENLTSQQFGSLAYGPVNVPNVSALTIDDTTQGEYEFRSS